MDRRCVVGESDLHSALVVEDGNTVAGTEQQAPASPPGRPGGVELVPTTLIDRYEIERWLGAGGMGVVYAARDIHLGRAVAVKLVGPRIDTGSGQGSLVREAQALARLRHPNIAAVYDIGLSSDRLFVVMELVDGGTVADWLKSEARSWHEILNVYLQAARGLAAAHAAGFVHRDFKPENVLLGKEGVARVSDFGVARIIGEAERDSAEGVPEERSATRTGGVVGTPGYIAPEILRHEVVDGRADQFSFCVSLYAALYGERPFELLEGPGRVVETLGRRRPARRRIGPRWLERFVERGLATDPRDRWPTMDALARAIEQRIGRRRGRLVLSGIGATAVAATAIWMGTRPAPAPLPDWSPVIIERDSNDASVSMAVSRDGSTVVKYSDTEAWVEAQVGVGPRRHVLLSVPGKVMSCTLSRTGEQLICSFDTGPGGFEIWTLDVATGRAERRVPPMAAPTLKPSFVFDVGPDGSILFGTDDHTALWRADATGGVQRVVTAKPGQKLLNSVWSPDGTRIAFKVVAPEGFRIEVMKTGTGAVSVVSHRTCKLVEWLTENSLACVPLTFQRPVLIELLIPAGGGEATERVRYNGPEYQQMGDELSTSSAGVLFMTTPNDLHLGLVALDAPGNVRRISSGGITDLPAAGWTSSGLLIFGANVQGHLRIMAMGTDGRIERLREGPVAEVPLVVLGETIVFGRFPGGESTIPFEEVPVGRRYPDGELFRLDLPGGAVQPMGSTRGFSAILCAGGRATPCLLAERSQGDMIAVDWDAETGARGRQRARWSMTSYPGQSALSPDARTLAQLQGFFGINEISLLDLESGDRRVIHVPGTSFHSPRWLADGTLIAMASSRAGESRIVRVSDAQEIETVRVAQPRDPPLIGAEDFEITPDGKTAAVLMFQYAGTFWWVPRSQE